MTLIKFVNYLTQQLISQYDNMISDNMIQDQKHWGEVLITRVSNTPHLPHYQSLLFGNFGLKWMLAGMILFSLNFFYVTPEFECADGEVKPGENCENYVCSLPQNLWYDHLAKPIPKSIALDYGVIMLCSNKWISSVLQSVSYLGSFIGYIVMSHIADNFGRKRTERIAWIINILGLILLISSFNLAMVGIGSFFMGLGTNAAITLHYTFLKQLLIGKMRERSFLILQVMFSLGVGFVALASWLIYDWKIVAGAFMLLPALAIFPYSLWIIQQTPNFSLKRGKQVLLASINKIARLNKEDQLVLQDLQFIPEPTHVQAKGTEYSLIDLFRYKSLRYITIVCAVIDLVVEFIYDGTILSLDKIGINVYLDQILVGFVEIFAAIFCSYIIVKVRRKEFLRLCLLLVAIFTCIIGIITLIFEHKDNQINSHVIAEMVLLAFLRFVLNCMWGLFFVYASELFPSNVLSIAFGWISAMGTVGAVGSPFIRLLTTNATMFFMCGLCILTLFLIKDLRQTKNEKACQEIEERAQQNMNKKSTVSQKQDN